MMFVMATFSKFTKLKTGYYLIYHTGQLIKLITINLLDIICVCKEKRLAWLTIFPQNYLNYFKWISFKLQIWRTQFQEITFHDLRISEYRSSRPDVFCKIGVLRNFTKFTGKPVYQSLFFGLQLKKETLVLWILWNF